MAFTAPLEPGFPAVARVVRRQGDMLPDRTDIREEALSAAVLSAHERELWARLPPSARRRRQWLFGRLAVKDAVASLLAERTGASVHRASVEVLTHPLGAPYVRLPLAHRQGRLAVSIAHSGDVAVAIATEDAAVRGLGIDVEQVRPRSALERKGLTAAERRALCDVPEQLRAETTLRWWCAKEAAVKALGLGLDRAGGAQAIVVTALRPDSGALRVELSGSADCPAQSLLATTRRDGDLVFATVVDPRSEPVSSRDA